MDLERNLWMPLATERELCFGCSSEGEGWVLYRQEEKKVSDCIWINKQLYWFAMWYILGFYVWIRCNNIWLKTNCIFSVLYSDPHGQTILWSHLTAASHGASATLPDRACFSIKTLAEGQVCSSCRRDTTLVSCPILGMGLSKQCLCLQCLFCLWFDSWHSISLNRLAWQLGPFVRVWYEGS